MRREERPQLTGHSPQITELQKEIRTVAGSDAKVLISGESGVGKELVANAIHALSARERFPLVAMNCAGLPDALLETELFGHRRGSFTGAYRDRAGKLEVAHRGTLFLDEIGEMTLRMQALLLRFLETGELQTVGAERQTVRVDVRVIAATNRDLRDMIADGRFREDLFYRLNVIHLVVPPLRDRAADIAALAEHFFTRLASRDGAQRRTLSPETLDALMRYPWPGNVRELQNVIERLAVTARASVIELGDLPAELRTEEGVSLRRKRERRRTVADDLYRRLREEHESFWTAVYPLYIQREITRDTMRELVHKGLEDARGNYRIVAKLFNLNSGDYRKFLSFLRQHQCQLPFREYRQ